MRKFRKLYDYVCFIYVNSLDCWHLTVVGLCVAFNTCVNKGKTGVMWSWLGNKSTWLVHLPIAHRIHSTLYKLLNIVYAEADFTFHTSYISCIHSFLTESQLSIRPQLHGQSILWTIQGVQFHESAQISKDIGGKEEESLSHCTPKPYRL